MPRKSAHAPVRQERKRRRRETMSTKEWADYQRQVARERKQKWQARAAATEEVSTDDAEDEEVRRHVGGCS